MQQLIPLPIRAAASQAECLLFKGAKAGDLGFQFGNRSGCRCAVHQLGFHLFDFAIGGVVQIIPILFAHRPVVGQEDGLLGQLGVFRPLFQPFTAALERLVNGFRRRGQAALEDGQGKANRAFTPIAFKLFGPVKLLAHVSRHRVVQVGFFGRERVVDGVSPAFGEEGLAIKLK